MNRGRYDVYVRKFAESISKAPLDMADLLALVPALKANNIQLEQMWDHIARLVLKMADTKLPQNHERKGSVLSEYQQSVFNLIQAFAHVQYQGKYQEPLWQWAEQRLRDQLDQVKANKNGSQVVVVLNAVIESVKGVETIYS